MPDHRRLTGASAERLSSIQPRLTDHEFDLSALIGRFQIFHNGHLGLIRKAVSVSERVLVLIGSANRSRDTRNPFDVNERGAMIWGTLLQEFTPEEVGQITICPLNDTSYDHKTWIAQVQLEARRNTTKLRPRTCLIGNIRDATSEYLDWFPEWTYLPVPDTQINATALREAYFAGGVDFEKTGWTDKGVVWKDMVPSGTIAVLEQFRGTSHYPYLMKQRAAEKAYREKWGEGPFQTVDPVIRMGGYVLMIERGGEEGTGMIALPGGFLETYEDLLDATVREAIEETALFIPHEKLAAFRAYLKGLLHPAPDYVLAARAKLKSFARGRGERFGDPHRSRRGRLITEAFYFDLPSDGHGLPQVHGSDDAKSAFWMPISDIDPVSTFEDHAFIVDKMLSLYA